jgi:hypothetical protein
VITTRTPEGEPLKCSICGEVSLVLVSLPSSDSVCPCCGAFSWIKIEQDLGPFLSQCDRAMLPPLLDRIRTSASRSQVCRLLADGISLLLKPESIRVSTIERNESDGVRLVLQAHRGHEANQTLEADIVNRLKDTNKAIRYKANETSVLVLPIIRQDRSLAGIIEVEHDSCLPDYRVEEQIRVVSSIGAVAIGTHLLD